MAFTSVNRCMYCSQILKIAQILWKTANTILHREQGPDAVVFVALEHHLAEAAKLNGSGGFRSSVLKPRKMVAACSAALVLMQATRAHARKREGKETALGQALRRMQSKYASMSWGGRAGRKE